jgi:hypothetical protein
MDRVSRMRHESSLSRYEHICHPLFLVMSGALNVPPLVFGIIGFVDWCSYFSGWLLGNAALCGLNLVMCIFSVYKIRKTTIRILGSFSRSGDVPSVDVGADHKSDSETDENSNTNDVPNLPLVPRKRGCCSQLSHYRTPSSERIRHLICYDGIITTYAIIFLVWIFWLSEGLQRIRQVDSAQEERAEDFDGCFSYHERYIKTSLVCGFAYFGFVVAACFASLYRHNNSM